MHQCRQNANTSRTFYASQTRNQSSTSLDPDNFGKKLELHPDPKAPLPEWRLAKTVEPQTPSAPAPSPQKTTLDLSESNPSNFPRSRNAPIPRYRNNPAVTPGFWSYVKYRILRFPEPPNPRLATKPTFNVLTNPYKARKTWPPILSQMSEIEQFHYEKKFRRRLLNKTHSMRTNWDRWTLFLRRFGVGFLLFYFAFVAEPGDPDERLPPDGLRYWVYGKMTALEGFWPARVGGWIEDQYQYYKRKHKRQWDPYNHEGWDETRPRNSLPGKVAPPSNAPLGEMSSVEQRPY